MIRVGKKPEESERAPIAECRVSRWHVVKAVLFHRCRKALGLSQSAIARALVIASDRTIRRWEQNELTVAGPAWVALETMLRGAGETALAARVTEVIEQRRQR